MKILQCSVDNCDRESAVDIWPEDDSRAFLCAHHFAQTRRQDWTVFKVAGRDLLLDTSGSWMYIPERDEALQALAVKEGLV